MKQTIYIWLMLLGSIGLTAQRNDYVWIGGYDSYSKRDTTKLNNSWGISKLDFNQTPRSVTYDSLGMNFARAVVSYSDDSGKLLFYCNGFQLRNKWDELIQYGDTHGLLPIGGLAAGTYLYRVQSSGEYLYAGKLLKTR
jgi:hypothetical protein